MSFWINFLFILFWHYLVLIIVSRIDYKFFYIECNRTDISFFKIREKRYEKILKIKKWKDLVPQYVGKTGFSKKKMISLKLDYIKRFIAETYRAEVDHLICCLVIPFIFLFNNFNLSIIFSSIVCISNIPCILIQKYNRLRLRHLMLNFMNTRNNKVPEV